MKRDPIDAAEFQLLTIRALRMILAFVVNGPDGPFMKLVRSGGLDKDLESAQMRLGGFDKVEK